jgi:hypothetical protein
MGGVCFPDTFQYIGYPKAQAVFALFPRLEKRQRVPGGESSADVGTIRWFHCHYV